jgi:hypothetical protein
MARNGSGTYSLPASSWNPAATNTTIESSAANTTLQDIAAALTQSLSKDGQTVPTGNIQLGNNKLINVADGAAASDAATYGQVQAVSSVAVAAASVADLARYQPFIVALSGLTTTITAGTIKGYFYTPFQLMVSEPFATLAVAQASGSTVTVDINAAGVSILSTRVTIDNTQLTSWSSSVQPVVATASIPAHTLISFDIDQAAVGTAAAGLEAGFIAVRTA